MGLGVGWVAVWGEGRVLGEGHYTYSSRDYDSTQVSKLTQRASGVLYPTHRLNSRWMGTWSFEAPCGKSSGGHDSLGDRGKTLIEEAEGFVNVGFGNVHCGRHAQDVVVHSALADEEATLAGCFEHLDGNG